MARSRITLDRRGMSELLRSPEVRADLSRRMDRVEGAAKAGADVDTGEYRNRIHRESVTTDRAVERVVASAPHSLFVEARTGNLTRALNAAGGS